VTGRLDGKKALVTGGSRGVGRAIVEAFVKEGATVVASASSTDSLAALAENPEIHTIAADLSNPIATEKLFESTLATCGHVDILVNNAGIYLSKPFEEYSLGDAEKLMRINVYAVMQLSQLAVRHMGTRGSGKIIQISSTAGKWESPNQALYNTTKHAVVGMSKCIALETANHGIHGQHDMSRHGRYGYVL
jgi:meso-butanediol dehydrogenase/(S,S)-butanediol dehydrogenase/diacetyl reductase